MQKKKMSTDIIWMLLSLCNFFNIVSYLFDDENNWQLIEIILKFSLCIHQNKSWHIQSSIWVQLTIRKGIEFKDRRHLFYFKSRPQKLKNHHCQSACKKNLKGTGTCSLFATRTRNGNALLFYRHFPNTVIDSEIYEYVFVGANKTRAASWPPLCDIVKHVLWFRTELCVDHTTMADYGVSNNNIKIKRNFIII